MMRTRIPLSAGVALIVFLVGLVPAIAADDSDEEIAEVVDEAEEWAEELAEFIEETLDDSNAFVGEFDQLAENVRKFIEEHDELLGDISDELGSPQANPVSVTDTVVEFGEPENVWTDEHGVLHIRDQLIVLESTGDVAGSVHVMQRFLDIDLGTGTGYGFGTVRFDYSWQGLSGIFEGPFVIEILPDGFVAKALAEGSGGFAEMHFIATQTPTVTEDVFQAEAIILNPQEEDDEDEDEDDEDEGDEDEEGDD